MKVKRVEWLPVYEVDRGMGEGIIKPHFCVPLSRPNGFETNDCRINYDDIWREGILCLVPILEQHPRGGRRIGRIREKEKERRDGASSSILILILSLTRPLIDFSKLYFLSGTKEDSRFVDLVNEYFDAHIFQFFEIQRTILLIR